MTEEWEAHSLLFISRLKQASWTYVKSNNQTQIVGLIGAASFSELTHTNCNRAAVQLTNLVIHNCQLRAVRSSCTSSLGFKPVGHVRLSNQSWHPVSIALTPYQLIRTTQFVAHNRYNECPRSTSCLRIQRQSATFGPTPFTATKCLCSRRGSSGASHYYWIL